MPTRANCPVIVDEAQNLGYEAFRPIASLARVNPEGDPLEQPGPNSLFIVDDAHQQIYGQPWCRAAVPACGSTTAPHGKSCTPRCPCSATCRWTDLDGDTDTLAGCRSLGGGPEPEFLEMQDLEHRAELLQQWIAALQSEFDYGLQDICLVCRTNSQCNKWDKAVRSANLPTHKIQTAQDARQTGAVQLTTAHRVKGLELPAVAIMDAGPGNFPLRVAVNAADSQADREPVLACCIWRYPEPSGTCCCARTRFSPFLEPMLDVKTQEPATD